MDTTVDGFLRNPGQELVDELKAFTKRVLDFDHDGDVDKDDALYIVKKAGAEILHIAHDTWDAIAPELPGLAAQAVVAAATMTGDKRRIALQDIVQVLADDSVHAAIASGREEAAAIGDKYGVPGALVGTLVDATYMNLKAAGKIR